MSSENINVSGVIEGLAPFADCIRNVILMTGDIIEVKLSGEYGIQVFKVFVNGKLMSMTLSEGAAIRKYNAYVIYLNDLMFGLTSKSEDK